MIDEASSPSSHAATCSSLHQANAWRSTRAGELSPVPGHPWGLAATTDGHDAVAVLGSSVLVEHLDRGRLRPVRTVSLPPDAEGTGAAMTPDGRLLLVASNSGLLAYSVAALTRTGPGLLGELSSPDELAYGDAVEVVSSRDGRFAFVSLERSGAVAVFDLAAAATSHWHRSGYVGRVRLGANVVGSALSRDGSTLYVTSEQARDRDPDGRGTLSVLSVPRLTRNPAHAELGTVLAGCSPVRVAVSPDGRRVAVTARGDNTLLLFDGRRLLHDPPHARLSVVRVGAAPVGVSFIDETHLVVANSNRFNAPSQDPSISIVTTSLTGELATVTHQYDTGAFPREVLVDTMAGVVIVSDYTAEEVHTLPIHELV